MNPTHSLATLVSVEPIGWLLVLLSLYFRGERRTARLQRGGLATTRVEPSTSTSYSSLGLFAVLRLIGSLAYLVLTQHVFGASKSGHAGELLATAAFWAAYVAATVCVFFVVAEVLKTSLSPLPGLTAAALIVFRWAAIVALILALTAHLPLYGIHSMAQWLNEVDTSFTLCVCSFEVALLYLLVKQLNRLGLLLRSRPVGLALGLAMIGCMDLLATVTQNLPPQYSVWFSTLNELGLFLALGMWAFYLVAPEPVRTAPRLTPNSRLMRWEEIARQFGTAGNQGESDPFISRVESTVAAILKKHNVGNYS